MSGRRNFLGALAGGAATVWLGAPWREVLAAGRHAALGARHAGPWERLTEAEARDLDAITALILPTDDTPGAREAQVVRFIDRALATFAADQLPLYQQGLRELRLWAAGQRPIAKGFSELETAVQIARLEALERGNSQFFESVRTATLLGMFANPEYGGNADKLGWRLLGFEDRFAWQPPFGDYDRA